MIAALALMAGIAGGAEAIAIPEDKSNPELIPGRLPTQRRADRSS